MEQPQINERVLVEEAEGHTLPQVLEGTALPQRGIVVGPPPTESEGHWMVLLPIGRVVVHQDQLSPLRDELPDPGGLLGTPVFEAIWQRIKGWEIDIGDGPEGANGSHVAAIVVAAMEATTSEEPQS